MNCKKYSTSKWILKIMIHHIKMNIKKYNTSNQNEYLKVHHIKMNIKKYNTSKWILKSTSNQNEY